MLWRKTMLRLRSLFRPSAVDEELEDEVRFHVEKQAEEFIRQGVPEHEAARLARRKFGNVTLHKEECREARKLGWLEGIGQDVRLGVRTLRRTPGFTAIAVLTLALGIGPTSAMYSVIDQALLHPISVPDEQGLIWLQESSRDHAESASNPARLATGRRRTRSARWPGFTLTVRFGPAQKAGEAIGGEIFWGFARACCVRSCR